MRATHTGSRAPAASPSVHVRQWVRCDMLAEMKRLPLRSVGWLVPLTLVVHCVGDDSTQKDAGSDGSISDGTTSDVVPADGSANDVITDGEAGVPLTGAFSSALVLNDTTVAFGGPAVTATGDVVFAGALSDISGTVSINNLGFVSNGGNDMLVLRIAQNNGFKWVKSFGGTSDDRVYGVAVDAAGDVYLVGTIFCATATTTVSLGTQTFTCKHTGGSNAVVKLDGNTGAPKWVQSFDAAAVASSSCNNVAVNPNNGNVAVSCSISGDFAYTDTSSVVHNVTHPNGSNGDVFIAELDPTSGKVAQSAYYASSSTQSVSQLAYDGAGDLHVAGTISLNTNVFVPAASTSPEFTITKKGSAASEGVAFKLAATTWAHVWDNVFSGTGNTTGESITLDKTGAAFAAVSFGGTQTFVSQATSAGGQDTMVVALSSTGAPTAQFQIGANGDFTIRGRLAIDASNAVVVTGFYSGTGTSGPKIGTTTLPALAVGYAAYTAKVSHDLTTVSWARGNAPQVSDAGTSSSGVQLTGVAIDPSNQQVVETGAILSSTADLGDTKLVTRKYEGLFVLRRDP